jgi:phytoene dehydrogenase-like protein
MNQRSIAWLAGYGYAALVAASFLEDAKEHGAQVHYSAEVNKIIDKAGSTTGCHLSP